MICARPSSGPSSSAGSPGPRRAGPSLLPLVLLLVGGLSSGPGASGCSSDDGDEATRPGGTDLGEGGDGGDPGDAGLLDAGPLDLGHWPDLAAWQESRPRVTAVVPAHGVVSGGETVTLEGSGFVRATAVRFGGTAVASFQVEGPDRIRVRTAPAAAAGPVDVEVATDDSVAVLAEGFQYVAPLQLQAIEPAEAPLDGGVPALLRGAGFSGGLALQVGAGRAWDIEILDDGRASVVLPPNPAGWADAWLFAGGSVVRLPDAVRYREPPAVSGLSPRLGPLAGGTLVQVQGRGFDAATTVSLGGLPVLPTVEERGTTLRFVTPPSQTPGPVELRLGTSVGEAVLADAFIYLAGDGAPALRAVVPAAGPTAGGNSLELLGEGLSDGATITLGGVPLPDCRLLDATQLSCPHVPPHAAGVVDLVVQLADGPTLTLPGAYTYLGELRLRAVLPASGPEAGGIAMELQGEGFTAGARVLFGGVPARGVRVHPGGTRISAVLPQGEAGTVDVRVQLSDGRQDVLPAAFTYLGRTSLLAVDPPKGSIAGGTLVRLLGAGFRPGMLVLFGGQPVLQYSVESPTRITLRTPPAEAEGPVDVEIAGEAVLPLAWDYFDPFSRAGGVWGDPIDGAVNVAVHDSYTGDPVVGATVVLGPEPTVDPLGVTDARGLITLSTAELAGPLDIHAGHPDYEPGSFLHTSGSNATFYLIPDVPPTSGGGGPGEIEEVDGTISGQLWGLDKYIPVPDDPDWERVAYVETTQEGTYGGNPYPGAGGTLYEDGPYLITVRPGDLAVVAVAGLYNARTGEFIPMRLGLHRFLFMPLRGQLQDVDVMLDVRLDHRIGVRLLSPPYDFERGPDELQLDSWLQFQPEGFYQPHNTVTGTLQEFWVEYLPDPDATSIQDVQLHFQTGLYTQGTRPYSVVWTGNVPLDTETLDIGPFVGIPRLVDPSSTRSLGPDYTFSWTVWGGTEPDVYSIRMLDAALAPAWRIILPGPLRSFRLPALAGVFEVPAGRPYLAITAGRTPVFTTDSFDYGSLSVRAWDSWALDYVDFLHTPAP